MALTRTDAPVKRKTDDKVERGTGAAEYTVKHRRASKKQRDTIDGCLAQAQEDGCSRRVQIAVIMCITQESGAGELAGVMTGNDDVGIFQQGRNWISEEGSKDPGQSTHAFLTSPRQGWRAAHGGLKKAPGNLSVAIHKVQGNQDPMAYAPWEGEATKTVDSYQGGGGDSSEGGGQAKAFSFTRGEKSGSREDSWEAAGRLVDEVGAYRWAAGNVFYAASGDELRAGKPSLMIRGDEGWLLKQPAWSWASARAITEVTLEALADRWDVMPGGGVALHRDFGAMAGRWYVWNVSGPSLTSPEATIVLRRPTRLKSEPAHETSAKTGGSEDGGSGDGDLKDICKRISDNRATYVYGGSHGTPLSKMKDTDHMDCSSSCSYALHKAGLFGDRTTAIVSGAFAASYGKPGKGDEFTINANGEHVWIEFADGSRFDTSRHSGKSGPMYTTVKRNDQGRFTQRHHPSH